MAIYVSVCEVRGHNAYWCISSERNSYLHRLSLADKGGDRIQVYRQVNSMTRLLYPRYMLENDFLNRLGSSCVPEQ